jgi:hypothetical protein
MNHVGLARRGSIGVERANHVESQGDRHLEDQLPMRFDADRMPDHTPDLRK